MIAYCGLTCDNCPIHMATLEDDKSHQLEMRISISEQCTNYYGMNLQPEDITDCDGCRSNDDRLFSGCLRCEIRKCASAKSIANCAYCSAYPCERLQNHFSTDPESRIRLEEIRYTNDIV